MKTVETTKENILKAHKDGCSDVKTALENLYPDLFGDGYVDFKEFKDMHDRESGSILMFDNTGENGVLLHNIHHDWELKENPDNGDYMVLRAKKKQ